MNEQLMMVEVIFHDKTFDDFRCAAFPLNHLNMCNNVEVWTVGWTKQTLLQFHFGFLDNKACVCICVRTGSVMERRAITPPVGSPVGRPLYLPPQDKTLLSLDKIAKRECKVLVVDPVS